MDRFASAPPRPRHPCHPPLRARHTPALQCSTSDLQHSTTAPATPLPPAPPAAPATHPPSGTPHPIISTPQPRPRHPATRWIVEAFGASPAVTPYAETYLRVSLFGIPSMLLVLAYTGVLRGGQDTRTPLFVSIGGFSANLLLNVVFVLVLGWGIAGAAWGTVLAQTGSAVVYVAVVLRAARYTGHRSVPTWPGCGRPPRRASASWSGRPHSASSSSWERRSPPAWGRRDRRLPGRLPGVDAAGRPQPRPQRTRPPVLHIRPPAHRNRSRDAPATGAPQPRPRRICPPVLHVWPPAVCVVPGPVHNAE